LRTAPDPRIDARWPIVWVEDDPFYARPDAGGLLLCACDQTDVDPDALVDDPAEVERILERAARWLPGLFADPTARPAILRWGSGMRTMTEDGSFVIGRDPGVAGLFWAAGLGGHGILTSPVVGDIASSMLAGEEVFDPAAAACDPARFAARP
jgi:D-arginine dehydrogenase